MIDKVLRPMSLVDHKEKVESIYLDADRHLSLNRTLVMGVINVTPDSFSDGGSYDSASGAVTRAVEMLDQGADIIDIGGESSRPGAASVTSDEESNRVLPVIKGIREISTAAMSIDTCKASVAAAALDAGADIINDISALRQDPEMVRLVADRGVPVILMHMLGTPAMMQEAPYYDDCVGEIVEFFAERIAFCRSNGVDPSRIIIDPGIGFGKRLQDNLDILARLAEFKRLGLPVMVGTSRKSFIKMIHDTGGLPRNRIGGSIASMIAAVLNGADIVRVHDVAETVEALSVVKAVREKR